jgi:nucleoside-diphosphate-sugar epimerase
MEQPQAANQRYIGSAGFLSFRDISAILMKAYPEKKIPSREFPDWVVRIFSNFEPTLKPVLIDLGAERKLNHSKAVNELGWQPLTPEEAVLAAATSILQLGIVK